ncbi:MULTISPECIES: polyprenol monophosphomannose synthase [Capnocytophaga]|uniref:polyprenol monophosphomannose synthase n=1 Tax=Capnocytophaga TaxID=1016 RepID=UPI000BB19E59|nr:MULTISPECIES: polyprenol monophosphomannose synthase [Capnocytophaga]ATA72658.1 dolichyl-phosphate beta-D-mannosyltransferase [Capnocytophaga sp. H4358]ATA74769.1 dolichyl-phosphate beta-D-mannosyltransferase [Capnocytophaga sp. H2931]GIM61876.1 dolichyl-phosphate beta-D-mannosyltransferase [Capnocytophaga canis]
MLVIIPTYNEIENIEAIIKAVFDQSEKFHILIVDDNSPDGTSQKVRELQQIFSERLFLEVRTEKKGLGTAYIHGFKWALRRNYDYIFEMDADFSHNPADLLRLYTECTQNGSDVAIGSRYVKGVNVVNWPLSRILLSYGASLYVKIITGMKIHDPTAGFVCYSRKVIESIDLDGIEFVGYAFQIEMKYKTYIKKFKISEVPIIFTDRVRGKSKMNGNIIKEAIWGVIAMKLRNIF